MAVQHFHLFETTIGPCALIWEGERFVGAQLPERDEETARRRLARRFPEAQETAAEGFVAEAVAGIRALFAGEKRDLSGLPVALDTDIEQVLANLSHDKKNVDGALHWVLPRAEGGVSIDTGVPLDVVRQALADLSRVTGERVL